MNTSGGFVSVVIPTFNRRTTLARVIKPVLDDSSTGEVVVVVDGCQDGTLEFLREWAQSEPRIRVIYQENAGEGIARRKGVEEAQYDTVVLLDDDVEASVGLISAHASWHLDNDHRLVLGYMPTRVPYPRSSGQVATVLYAEDYESTCKLYETDSRSIFTHLWAGNMSLRRCNALNVGLGGQSRLGYHEDLRFGLKCQEAGLEAVFDRSLLAWHSHSRNLRKFATESRRSGEGRVQLMRAYPSLAEDLNPFSSMSVREITIVRYLGSALTRPISAPLAMATSYVSGRLKVWRLETIFARVLRLIEISFGFKRAGKVRHFG
jgi:glycosyltransferase involved in cell wall biosynthesis